MVFNKNFSGLMGAKNDALVLPQLPCIKKTSDKDTFVQIEIPTYVGTGCDGEQRRRITGLSPRVWGNLQMPYEERREVRSIPTCVGEPLS